MVILSFIFCLFSLAIACAFHKELSKMWICALTAVFTSNALVVLENLVKSL